MGEVILGLPGQWADSKAEESDHYTTKIGGLPDWPIPGASVRPGLLLCDACGNNLALVSQVYAPISSSKVKIEERVIYVFGCLMTKCVSSSASWKALRVQTLMSDMDMNALCIEAVPPTISHHSASINNAMEDLWTFDTNEDEDDVDLDNLSRAFAEAASLAYNPKKQHDDSVVEATVEPSIVTRTTRVIGEKVPVLPCFYIYTQKEALSRGSTSKTTSCSSISVTEKQSCSDDENWEMERYEYDIALNADRTYLKFKKKVDAYPEQCFRYSYSGNPLLATGEVADPGTCKLCGGPRHYEMQLMPPLLYFLQEQGLDCKDHSLDNWNWMTLIIYTCAASCSDSNEGTSEEWTFAEEKVVVQYE